MTKRQKTDREIIAAARKRYAGRREVSTTIKGIQCRLCGSRKTITEFYRLLGMRAPTIGVTACNDCGAC